MISRMDKNIHTDVPIFLKNPSTNDLLHEVKNVIPENTKVYLFGGSIRNAIYYDYFGEEMTQRDFDCIVIGDGEKFAENLLRSGFVYGSKNNEKAKVLKKARFPNPEHPYDDWLYLDCKIYPNSETIENILNRISDFTISGVALNMSEMDTPNWQNNVISIPNAIKNIQEKRLAVVKPYAISIHKIIRMISRGFQSPSQNEVAICIAKLHDIQEDKFIINTEKTIRYVGNKEKATEIARKLGISYDIFNFEEMRKN